MTRHFQWHDIPIKWHGIPDTELFIFENFPRNHSTNCFGVKESKYGKILTWAPQGTLLEDAHAGMTIFFENYYPISKVEGFYIKKLSLEFLIFLRHNNFFLKMKTFFRHKPKLLVLRTLWMFVKFLKFVAENPRIPFYPFIFLYHENMEFRVFCGIFNEIFKKFQILFFPYMKLQLLINNVFIIFDNCAFKIQNSKKTRIWTVS